MYTTLEAREVETFGALETRDYSMKASGKAFKILINNLYADKPLAVTRELWSNAYDSHAAAGKADVPFDVHLPTEFDPQFSVRDYGVSMSHDAVMNIYSTLFESTKENDNDSVGKLGLGAKSPFAYTDTFMLTAWLNGEKRIYNAVINAKSIPQIMHVSTEPSDEPTGIEVSFPVRPDDIDLFETAAVRVVRGFECMPRFTGAPIDVEPMRVSLVDPTGDNRWKLLTGDEIIRNRAHALQGCVIYPIDAEAIADLTDSEKAILRLPLLINFPIGQLDITPSRESLSYDDNTQRNIREMARKVQEAICQTYVAQIGAEKTFWEACKLYQKLITTSHHMPGLEKILDKQTSFRGRPLRQRISLDNVVQRYNSTVRSMGGLAITKLERNALENKRRAPKWEPTSYANVNPGCDVVIFENIHDNMSNVGPRLQYAHERGLIPYGAAVLWVKADPDSAAWKRLFVHLGRPPVLAINDENFPRRPKGTSSRGFRPKTMMKTVDWKSSTEVDAMVDKDAAHFYVRKERTHYVKPNGQHFRYIGTVTDIRNALVKLGVMQPTDEVIIVPGTHKKKANRPGWKCLFTFANEHVDANLDVDAINNGLTLEKYLQGVSGIADYIKDRVERPEVLTYVKGTAADKFASFILRLKARLAQCNMQTEMRALASTLQHPKLQEAKGGKIPVNDKRYVDAFKEAYPLVATYLEAHMRYTTVNDVELTKVDRTINALDKLAAEDQAAGTDNAQQLAA